MCLRCKKSDIQHTRIINDAINDGSDVKLKASNESPKIQRNLSLKKLKMTILMTAFKVRCRYRIQNREN